VNRRAAAPGPPPPLTVVAVALVRGGDGGSRVLVARRAHPVALAGLWEFPGGKVEPGETEPAAGARECLEELDVVVRVGGRVHRPVAVPGPGGPVTLVLRRGQVLAGEPRALVHAELRWVGPEDLGGLPWLPTNRQLLPAVRALLSAAAGTGDGPHAALP
jgi:8-oxo-dGTP diphosphatase